MKKKFIILTSLIVLGTSVWAQEQSLYTQYMFNGLSINPAYSATDQAAVATLWDREQWVGLDGAPKTSSASFYSPINHSNLSLGALITYDRLGVNKSSNGDLSAAYRVQLNRSLYLSLGLSLGLRSGISELTQFNTKDPLFANVETDLFGNIGLGAMIYSDRFYVGLSAPQLKGFLIREAESGLTSGKYLRHYYLSAGYLLPLSRDLALKPNVLVRYSYNSPVVDLNCNLWIQQRLWVGASYRVNQDFSALIQFAVTPQLQVGYSYDFGTQMTRQISSGSHEFMISYRFIKNSKNIQATRWF